MNEAATPSPSTRRFSVAWCLGAGLFHFAVSIIIFDNYIGVEMGRYFEDATSKIAFWRGALWLWTPLATANLENQSGLFIRLVFCAWPCVIAVIVGLAAPVVVRWLHRRINVSGVPDDQTRNDQPSPLLGAMRRVFALGVKRKTRIRFASTLIICEALWAGWLYYDRFVAAHRSFTIRDSFKFKPVVKVIRRASTFTLYEGLPREFDRPVFADEWANRKRIQIYGFAFMSGLSRSRPRTSRRCAAWRHQQALFGRGPAQNSVEVFIRTTASRGATEPPLTTS